MHLQFSVFKNCFIINFIKIYGLIVPDMINISSNNTYEAHIVNIMWLMCDVG